MKIILLFVVFLVSMNCSHSLLQLLSSNKRTALKNEILNLAKKTERGLVESQSEKLKMKKLFEELEKLNPTPASLGSPLVNKVWNLEYTTSDTILGRGSQKRVGPILQLIDARNLKAQNSETVDYGFGLKVKRTVTADLKPISKSKVAVQFKRFTLGPISFNAPSSFKGELDITYIDSDVRLSRGDKGNIFVLTPYSDL